MQGNALPQHPVAVQSTWGLIFGLTSKAREVIRPLSARVAIVRRRLAIGRRSGFYLLSLGFCGTGAADGARRTVDCSSQNQ